MILVLHIHNWPTWHIQLPTGLLHSPTVQDGAGRWRRSDYFSETGTLLLYGPFEKGTTLRVAFLPGGRSGPGVGRVYRYFDYKNDQFIAVEEP